MIAYVLRNTIIALLAVGVSSCYFFRKKDVSSDNGSAASGSLGQPITDSASGPNEALLQELYLVTSANAPAAIRPDPDLFVRRLLLQYREEGATVARQIGQVEEFRILLGGATQDFSQKPALTYDATSLLATYKVAEEVCRGLVAPVGWEYEGWTTILPNEVGNVTENVRWLAQRILGKPSSTIAEADIESLIEIMDDARAGQPYSEESYVPVCATLIVDAETLLL
jgi:hypothetical protein